MNVHSFFADVSKSESGTYVGYAVYSSSLNIQLQFKISSYAIIFIGEGLAILKCVEHIVENGIANSCIFFDSRSFLTALVSTKFERNQNYIVILVKDKLQQALDRNFIIKLY